MSELALVQGLILIVLGLAITFLGRKLVKIVFFLVGGVIGAILAFMIAPLFVAPPFTYLVAILGFIVVGLIFYLLLPFGAGLLAGLATFLILKGMVSLILAALLALIVLIVVVVLFNKILAVVTAFIGSLIFLVGLGELGMAFPWPIKLAAIVLLTVLGSIVQFKT